jgi:hypothetical protein
MVTHTDHRHSLDAEFLHPRDAKILHIEADDDGVELTVAVACPECGQTLDLVAPVERIVESDVELPLEDAEEAYD